MKSFLKFLLRFVRCSSGNALLEATIAVPMILSLLAGVVDFGFALSAQATANKSVRNAARYLAGVPSAAVCTWGLENAQNLALYGKLNPIIGTDTPLVSGWAVNGGSNNNVRLGPDTDCTMPKVIHVQAMVPHQSLFLSIILPNTGALTLSAEHQERLTGG